MNSLTISKMENSNTTDQGQENPEVASKQSTPPSDDIQRDRNDIRNLPANLPSTPTSPASPIPILPEPLKYQTRDGTYLSQLYNQPLVTTLTSFSQVANLVRNPYELLNNVDEFVRQASGSGTNNKRKGSRTSENFAKMLNQNRQSLTPVKTPVQQEMNTFVRHNHESSSMMNDSDDTGNEKIHRDLSSSPIPVIPPIEATTKRGRMSPLTIEEYEEKFRLSATDIELVERVFAGSMACNQLRAALWPYIFGLVLHRGRFDAIDSGKYIFVEHEANNSRWRELTQLFHVYQSQWRAIIPDQELRFSTFRERKSLIERDVIRCDRLHPFYAEEPQNLDKLTQLLMTYMMYDFDIGYVQGMSDIAGPILYMYNGDLVKSFWIFVEVMKLFRRNFELTQKTIHFQLNCLYELIKNTDPIFAQYLEDNESSNCFFAFRAIVCQFKRELMKEDEDDYNKVLFLWDTIWCVARRHVLQEEMKAYNSPPAEQNLKNETKTVTDQPSGTDATVSPFVFAVDPNQADSHRYKLSETEVFVLALCLSMIRRERDIVLANRLDSTDIHLHFIDPKLANDLDTFIEHAINIYSFLKNDFDITRLTSPKKQSNGSTNQSASDQNAIDFMDANVDASPTSANDYDSLSDFLIINGASGS